MISRKGKLPDCQYNTLAETLSEMPAGIRILGEGCAADKRFICNIVAVYQSEGSRLSQTAQATRSHCEIIGAWETGTRRHGRTSPCWDVPLYL